MNSDNINLNSTLILYKYMLHRRYSYYLETDTRWVGDSGVDYYFDLMPTGLGPQLKVRFISLWSNE